MILGSTSNFPLFVLMYLTPCLLLSFDFKKSTVRKFFGWLPDSELKVYVIVNLPFFCNAGCNITF